MPKGFLWYIIKLIFGWLLELAFFPLWWYSIGWWALAKKLAAFMADEFQSLNIGVWVRNLFVPMYGQRDIPSFFISFFVRLAQIIFRSLWWLVLALVCFLLLALWPLAPIFIAAQLYFQLL